MILCKPTVFQMALHHNCLLLLPAPMSALVVFDFETSGLKPAQGARVIEVGAVLVEGGAIRASFQSLINPGFPVSSFITAFTGISNLTLVLGGVIASLIWMGVKEPGHA